MKYNPVSREAFADLPPADGARAYFDVVDTMRASTAIGVAECVSRGLTIDAETLDAYRRYTADWVEALDARDRLVEEAAR